MGGDDAHRTADDDSAAVQLRVLLALLTPLMMKSLIAATSILR
jgi:hypothetical protein